MLTVHRWSRLARAGMVTLGLAAGIAVAGPVGTARADTVRDAQMWVLDAVNAPTAWSVTEGQGATVAVIDSGVNPGVSDLAGSVFSGPDLTGVRTPPANPNWGVHGTWMASLIAGHGHAGGSSGIMGVAPRSKVLSIRVVTDRHDPGFAAYEHETDRRVQQALAQAIEYAIKRRVNVISMSLGYGDPSGVVRSALQDALSHRIVVVASSGNSGNSVGARAAGHAPYSFPADYPGVLGVAAVGHSGSSAGFSSFNLSVQVAAPGVNVPAQGRDGQYWLVSGTSPACALTAGVAALIKAKYPHLASALVVRAITDSTDHRPPGGYDDQVGFGTVNAAAALASAGRLASQLRAQAGAPVTLHFGGGSAAGPPVPVQPRGPAALITACLVALGCLALAAVTGTRLVTLRRAYESRGQHAASSRSPYWPGGTIPRNPSGIGPGGTIPRHPSPEISHDRTGWAGERPPGSTDPATDWRSGLGPGS